MLVQSVDKHYNASHQPDGAIVTWTDKTKGSQGVQTFLVGQLPTTLNTAADVETWFNAITGTDPNQSRVGAYFGCYALTQVNSFIKGVMCDFDLVMSETPIYGSPFGQGF